MEKLFYGLGEWHWPKLQNFQMLMSVSFTGKERDLFVLLPFSVNGIQNPFSRACPAEWPEERGQGVSHYRMAQKNGPFKI
jgi:hypothetical protein